MAQIIIQKGQTLGGIAKSRGTTLSALLAANPQIKNPDLIIAGATLNVPEGPQKPVQVPQLPSGAPEGATPAPVQGPVQGPQLPSPQLTTPTVATSNVEANVEATEPFTLPSVEEISSTDLAEPAVTNEELQELVDKLAGEKPEVPSFADDFAAFRSEQGIGALESQLTSINSELERARAGLRLGEQKLEDQPITAGIISAQQLKLRRQEQENIDSILRRKQVILDELNTKNTLVSNLMSLTQMDYQVAVVAYNSEFSKNIQVLGIIEGYKTRADAEANRLRDDARANLNTIVNLATDSGKGFDDLNLDMRLKVEALEVKSGFPSGTLSTFWSVKPNTKIISTSTGFNANGEQIVTFIYQDPKTGKPGVIETVKTDVVKSSTVGDDAQQEITKIEKIFDESKGGDGFVSPETYARERRNSSISPSQFDQRFATTYSNPNDRKNLGVTKAEAGGVDEDKLDVFLTDANLQSVAEALISQLGKDDAIRSLDVGSINITDPKTGKKKEVKLSNEQIEKIKGFIESGGDGDNDEGKKPSLIQQVLSAITGAAS